MESAIKSSRSLSLIDSEVLKLLATKYSYDQKKIRKILKLPPTDIGKIIRRLPPLYDDNINSFGIDLKEQEFPAGKSRLPASIQKELIEEYEKALERKAPVKLFVPPSDRLFDWMVGRTNPKIKLMDHQTFSSREFMKKRGMILVHGTGSGKTITSIVIAECYLRNTSETKVIVVTPKSVREQFVAELENFVQNGSDTRPRYEFYTEYEFKDNNHIRPEACSRALVIIDEAQKRRTTIRENEATHTQFAKEYIIRCDMADKVLLLSATPFWNEKHDILNLVRMIVRHEITSADLDNPVVMKGLFSYVDPKIINKKVFPNVEQIRLSLPMGEHFYKKYLKMQEKGVRDFEARGGNIDISDNINEQEAGEKGKYGMFYSNIRQSGDVYPSPKYDFIFKNITEYPNSQIVIYSTFVERFLNVLSNKLDEKGIRYGKITGDESEDIRQNAIINYNAKQIKVLLISDSGREGISLNGTDIMIVSDPLFSPAATQQAVGRVARTNSHILPAVVKIFHLIIKKPDVLDVNDRIPLTGDEYVEKIAKRKERQLRDLMEIYIYKNSIEYLQE
jgi:superfamily II DNA or RNA helicase